MANKSGNINQLYFQNTHSNMNHNGPGGNQQQREINYINNNQPVHNSNNINQGLNQIVRNDLKSRGLIHTNPFHRDHARQEHERKAAILDNIKQQINLANNNKVHELERKRRDEEQYIQAMENHYPFGR